MPDVVLKVGGVKHGGWKSVQVSRALTQLSGTFSLELTDKWTKGKQAMSIKPGQACQVLLGAKPVITGFVDAVNPSYESKQHSIQVQGRDKTGDLVDCCHDGAVVQWENRTILQIAEELCKPFEIPVVMLAPEGAPFMQKTYNPTSTIMSFLGQLARERELLVMSLGDGALTFARTGISRAPALELGVNIKAGRGSFNNADRFSHYLLKGQGQVPLDQKLEFDQPGKEGENLKTQQKLLNPKAQATDSLITRHRPKVILASQAGDQAGMEARARWESCVRAGRSRTATYTVSGWEAKPGSLWGINQLVYVKDGFLGLDETLLIEKVDYSLGEGQGSTTTITVVHPNAYEAKPQENAANQIHTKLDFGGEE